MQAEALYTLSEVADVLGAPVAPCPCADCRGVRFQVLPTAACRGRQTCWMSDRISGSNLQRRCNSVRNCAMCRRLYVAHGSRDCYCSAHCEGALLTPCDLCGESIRSRDDAVTRQIVVERRTPYKRGDADWFPYVTAHAVRHAWCDATRLAEERESTQEA